MAPGSKLPILAALAVTMAWAAAAPTPAAEPDLISHIGLPSIASEANVGTLPSQLPDVTVATPAPPTGEELAGDSLSRFIAHHATVRVVTTATERNLARWRGGEQSICPVTVGLSATDDAFVTARVRALAAYVGAPTDSRPHCKGNVQIVFTSSPRGEMDAVIQWATAAFGIRYSGGNGDLIAYRPDHAIQGFYITTRGGSTVLNTDVALVGLDVLPVWPRIEQKYLGSGRIGSHLGGGSGSGAGIGVVILVVDTTRAAGLSIATLADALAMLALTVDQSPDHCDALPSILDLLSSGCGTRTPPAAITAGDLAFLKALYYLNTGLGPSLSRAEIRDNMAQQFARR